MVSTGCLSSYQYLVDCVSTHKRYASNWIIHFSQAKKTTCFQTKTTTTKMGWFLHGVWNPPWFWKPSKWTKKILALEPSTIFCFGWISLQINQEKIAVSPFPSIFYSKMIGFREFEVISAWKLFSESLHYMCGVFPCPTELNVDKTPNVLSLDPGFLQMMILFYLTDGSSWNPHWFVSCLLGCPWKLLTGWFHPYISRL